jgi:arsenate reductase-like glutaredoxin family protein
LKRPVIRVDKEVFVGYKKDTIAAAEMALKS